MTGSSLKPKVFSCTGCGASLTIEAVGYTNTVVCKHCLAVIDVNHPLKKIITQYENNHVREPLFELGSFGNLNGIKWKIIGYIVKEDVASGFLWDEYLLYNPYHGFCWLLEISGHFSIAKKLNAVPCAHSSSYASEFEYNKKNYKLFNVGKVKTAFVLGEFYWRVKAGDTVTMADYISPPEMLSSEIDGSEINWSSSFYISSKEVYSAFKLSPKRTPIFDIGVAANQPNPTGDRLSKYKEFFAALAGLTVVAMASLLTMPTKNLYTFNDIVAESTPVWNSSSNAVSAGPKPAISPSFKIEGMGNIGIEMSSPVNNEWVEASMSLVNEDTGQTFDFEQGVEFYSGTDSDGAWSEGSRYSDKIISSVPAGNYHLEVELKSNKPIPTASLVIKRNSMMMMNFIFAFAALVLPILLLAIRGHSFEVKRWENSDFNPYLRNGGYDDDDE
jgi:hypothetical protein